MLNRFNNRLLALPRGAKRGVMLATDIILLPAVMYMALGIRLGVWAIPLGTEQWLVLVLSALVPVPLLYWAGFYRAVVRYIGNELVWTVLWTTSLACVIVTSAFYMTGLQSLPRSVIAIFWALAVLYLGGSRFGVRLYFVRFLRACAGGVPVAIYGAGGAGVQLAFALSQATRYSPRFFIDDNLELQSVRVQGLRVYSRKALSGALRRHGVNTVLLAMPSVSRHDRQQVIDFLVTQKVKVKTMPALPDIVTGKARIEEIHDVAIEDLLGRDAVPPDTALLGAPVAGKNVLVTGAGGSIGSELCRQILAQRPKCLVLYERGEYELYAIERELQASLALTDSTTQVFPILGSVLNCKQLTHVCTRYGIQTVFHAAAYKHVPMVEANPLAGVENNILGTHCTAEAAQAAGVERLVFISTDKAVRPTNVMGATKRMAELVLQAMAAQGGKTIFTMVRFGNVLGSSGSVVPLFRKQIEAGGPVTLTHREIIRYFMTIPEAAQLVIQAGAMAQGGEVFLLDMGEPVKIYDLACRMIRLMGYGVRDLSHPEGDIEIEVTGLRPGEKLYEELLIGTDSMGTMHPKILQARESSLSWVEVAEALMQFRDVVNRRDTDTAVGLLRRYVKGFHKAVDPMTEDDTADEEVVVVQEILRDALDQTENVSDRFSVESIGR